MSAGALRIAIIGAGPCGLSQLLAFKNAELNGEEIPEIVCFEKQATHGGLWNYSWRTGVDSRGDLLPNGMYRHLWSNGPKECLEMANYSLDRHFGQQISSFPTREVLRDYLVGRVEDTFNTEGTAQQNIKRDKNIEVRYNTNVCGVTFDSETDTFTVVSQTDRNRNNKLDSSSEQFSHVIVCTGHFTCPNAPRFEGVEEFPGVVIHAKDFRDAAPFKDQDVLLIGSSYSAEDLALQCWKFGARSVTVSYKSNPMGFNWPSGITEVPLLHRLDADGVAHFVDGTSQKVSAVVLCTGYQHYFPFLDDELRLETTGNRLWYRPLYKGLFWTANPKLSYLGMHDQYYTFSMFDAQAWYVRDVILGNLKLPGVSTMRADNRRWSRRAAALKNCHDEIAFQTDYCKDIASATDYPMSDQQWDDIAEMFHTWEHDKDKSIVGYRDESHFASVITGTASIKHHTKWVNALDDTMQHFLNKYNK